MSQRAKRIKVILNESSRDLLYLYYENDLSGLDQILYQLSILYPNENLNCTNVKNLIINTSPHFSLEDFLDNVLKGNKKKSDYILKQLKTDKTVKPLTILRIMQQTVFLLITLKRQLLLNNNTKSQILLFNKHKIKKNRHTLFLKALQRLNLQQLYQITTLLLQMEIIIHQKHQNITWHNFELLIWILCDKKIS